MDKNKAAYKLKGLPPVYCINLDGEPERWFYMETQFKYWEIENYTRISAYDGREDDLSDIIKGRYPEDMSSAEIGCTTSHLKAIKHWLDTSDSPYAIIMEDDVDLSPVKNWSFKWVDFYSNGFRHVVGNTGENINGNSMTFAAFAAAPFYTSTGVPGTAD